MLDPVSFAAGAAANAAGNLLSDAAKRVAPAIWQSVSAAVQEAMQRALPQARRRFEENASTFVAALADEVARGADERATDEIADATTRKLEDPDVAVAVADAIRTAGRTSSADRHRALAKLVAARLASDTASASAVAANHAVRAMESLGAVHLRTLALLALCHYAGRPNALSPAYPRFPERPAATLRHDGTPDSARQFSEAYAAWTRDIDPLATAYARHLVERLRRDAERVGVPDEVPESVAVHLIAAACAIRHESHPELYEALARLIGPPPAPDASAADRAPERAVEMAYYEPLFLATRATDAVGRLADVWRSTLRYLAPTPTGLLIGLAALDVATDEQTSTEWQWAGVADHALALSPYVPVPSFDERWARDYKFQEVLEKALADMAGRGKLTRILKGR